MVANGSNIPNPIDRAKKEITYILEFENEAIRLFQGIINITEYLYRIIKMELMFDGNVPIVPQQPFES